jgi:hypothetical protein
MYIAFNNEEEDLEFIHVKRVIANSENDEIIVYGGGYEIILPVDTTQTTVENAVMSLTKLDRVDVRKWKDYIVTKI